MLTRMIDSVSETAGAAADLKKARRRKNVSMSDPIKLDRSAAAFVRKPNRACWAACCFRPTSAWASASRNSRTTARRFSTICGIRRFMSRWRRCIDQREAIDVITVQQRLKDKQLLEQVGGIAYLSQLQDAVPSAANLELLPGHRPGKIPAAENDPDLHGRRRAGL